MPICKTCGRFAQREATNHESYVLQTFAKTIAKFFGRYICKNCDSRDDIAKEIVTYPSKQFVHLLKLMGIQMSFIYDTDRSSSQIN
jgi:hypothetical protein